MSDFVFHEYYCKGCREFANGCNYMGRNGCKCIYEQAVDDVQFIQKCLNSALQHREELLKQLVEDMSDIEMYRGLLDKNKEIITEMEIKDKIYGGDKDGGISK